MTALLSSSSFSSYRSGTGAVLVSAWTPDHRAQRRIPSVQWYSHDEVPLSIDPDSLLSAASSPLSSSSSTSTTPYWKSSSHSSTSTATYLSSAPQHQPNSGHSRRRDTLKMQRPYHQYSRVQQQQPPLTPHLASRPVSLEGSSGSSPDHPSHRHPNRRRTTPPSQEPVVSASAPTAGLTRAEEIQYSFQIRTFRAAVRLRDQLVLHQCGMYIHPTEAQWAAACGTSIMQLRRVMHEGQEARLALVAANTGLVTQIAKRHYHGLKRALEYGGGMGTILALPDMIQEGNLGLMEAAERFEPEKGFRFSTYATYWVRQRILRAINDSSRTIRLPAHVHSILQKIKKAKWILHSDLGREPTLKELAKHMAVSEKKLQLYTDSSRNVISLEVPVRTTSLKEDRRTLGETLASDAPTPEDDLVAEYLRRDIRAVMDTTLADRERQVIVRRFGLEDGTPRSLEEIAQQMGISRDRVRLVEARALNKLRHPQRNYRLKEYLESSFLSSSSGAATQQQQQQPWHRNQGDSNNSNSMNHWMPWDDWSSAETVSSSDRTWFF